MVDNLLSAVLGFALWKYDLWLALPAILAVSLVYAATRHERMGPLLIHAGRVALWIIGFMLAVFVIMQIISWRL